MDSTSGSSANRLKAWVFTIQDYALLALHSVQNIFADKRCFVELVEQMDIIGVGSLKIIVVALICVGGSIVLNAASQFSRFGETSLTADAVSLGLLRELGPVFTALLVAGRNATTMASELGSMVISEQVDAIRVFGMDPIRRLMTPRVFATVLVLPVLVAVGNCAGLFGGFLVANITLHISAQTFWTRAIKALAFGDVFITVVKPIVFGFIISTIGCYQGFRVKGGAAGVGRATITAFVEGALTVLVANLFLTRLLLYAFHLL